MLVTEYDGEATDRDRQWIEVELYHVHLPMLADYDMVEFDIKDGTVTPKSTLDVERLNWSNAESGVLTGESD